MAAPENSSFHSQKNPFTRNVKVAQKVYFYYSFTEKKEIPTTADKDLLIESRAAPLCRKWFLKGY